MPTPSVLKVVRLAADRRAAARALSSVAAFVADAGVPASTADRLCIVVEEWLLNVIEHGGAPPGSLVSMRFERREAGVRLVLGDAGTAFDPRDAELSGPNTARGGGAGLALIRAWSRVEDYRRRGARNRLTLFLGDE